MRTSVELDCSVMVTKLYASFYRMLMTRVFPMARSDVMLSIVIVLLNPYTIVISVGTSSPVFRTYFVPYTPTEHTATSSASTAVPT